VTRSRSRRSAPPTSTCSSSSGVPVAARTTTPRSARTASPCRPTPASPSSGPPPSNRLRDDTIVLGVVAAQCISMEPTNPCAPGVVQVVQRGNGGGGGAWGVDQVLQPDPSYADQGFGVALDISADGRHVVVGTNPRQNDDPNRRGEVFVFER